MKRLIAIAAMIAAFGLGGAAAFAATADKPPSPPGQDECEHGNSQKPCKEDPQPDHGGDCDEHGNHGGVNEDHCAGETTTTETTTTTTETTTTETTTTETTTESTPTETTTESTPTESTPTQTSSNETTPQTETTPEETTSEDESEQQIFTPPRPQVVSAEASSQSGPASAAKPGSATKPTTAAQAAPFTP
jgi:hypothetical protein